MQNFISFDCILRHLTAVQNASLQHQLHRRERSSLPHTQKRSNQSNRSLSSSRTSISSRWQSLCTELPSTSTYSTAAVTSYYQQTPRTTCSLQSSLHRVTLYVYYAVHKWRQKKPVMSRTSNVNVIPGHDAVNKNINSSRRAKRRPSG